MNPRYTAPRESRACFGIISTDESQQVSRGTVEKNEHGRKILVGIEGAIKEMIHIENCL